MSEKNVFIKNIFRRITKEIKKERKRATWRIDECKEDWQYKQK